MTARTTTCEVKKTRRKPPAVQTVEEVVKPPRRGLPRGPDGKILPGKGRPPGSQNKITKTIKQMVMGALSKAGGEAYLVKQARYNPKAFLALVGRLIPAEVKVPDGTTVVLLDWQALLGDGTKAGDDAIDVTPTKQEGDDA